MEISLNYVLFYINCLFIFLFQYINLPIHAVIIFKKINIVILDSKRI